MFNFLKKKGNDENVKIRRENVSSICTSNKHTGRTNMEFKSDCLIIEYETGIVSIPYKNIESCGKIINDKYGIKEAMDKKILSQAVFESKGFLAGNFYTLTNSAKLFLYIKYKDEVGSPQTFLAEYDHGVDKAIRIIEKNRR